MSSTEREYRVLILSTKGRTTNFVYNQLFSFFPNIHVIIEKKISPYLLVKSRLKKLGFITTIGQLAFQAFVPPLLNLFSGRRITEIIQSFKILDSPIAEDRVSHIDSVNNESIIERIDKIKPEIIIVNGTRIISQKIIEQIACPIINIHVGITPQYRGVHGGYWALYNNDKKKFGVTVHYVDKGIDTGNVIRQMLITPDKKDNFVTYPILQYAIACSALPEIIKTVIQNKIYNSNSALISERGKIWYHPTLFQYLTARLTKNIK